MPPDARSPLTALDAALRSAVSVLSSLAGYTYAGADESTFEPVFEMSAGRPVLFDDLPIGVRHLVAFAALPLKALYASHSGAPILSPAKASSSSTMSNYIRTRAFSVLSLAR